MDDNRKVNAWALVLGSTCVVALILGTLLMFGERADGSEPYGGCDEGWQAPRSQGADDCRDMGWVVKARLVVGPNGWVHVVRLPRCATEDGGRCYWQARRQGNGRGVSFVNLGSTDEPRRVTVRGYLR
jgi:hypothetical protein